jgi:hypothetical protein
MDAVSWTPGAPFTNDGGRPVLKGLLLVFALAAAVPGLQAAPVLLSPTVRPVSGVAAARSTNVASRLDTPRARYSVQQFVTLPQQ